MDLLSRASSLIVAPMVLFAAGFAMPGAALAGRAPPEREVVLHDSQPVISLDGWPIEAWKSLGASARAADVLRAAEPELRSSSFGYQRGPVWLRIPILNQSSKTSWRLLLHPRTLQRVELNVFGVQGNLRQDAIFRAGHAGEGGSLDSLTPGFNLDLPLGERAVLIFKLEAYEQLGLDIRFEQPGAVESQERRVDMALGIYMGVLFALMFYTVLIYRTLKEDFFRPYLLFMGSMWVLVPSLNGGLDYLFRFPFLFSDFIALTTAATCLGGNEFCREFLKLRVHSPRLDRIQAGLSVLSGGAAVLSLPPLYKRIPDVVGPVNDTVLVCTVVLILTAAVVAVRQGVKSARYFMLAWMGFLFSCLVFLLSTHGFIPNTIFTRSAVEIGNTLEMLILAVAISDRVYELELERMATLRRALHADRLKSLVKMICHDITSPLSVVSTHAELAKRGSPASWDAVRRAVEEQDKIVSFVRDHGDLVDSGEDGPLKPVELGEVVATLRFLNEGRARVKGVALHFPEPSAVDGIRVWAQEATLVHSVLGNAISNAIKFSNTGSQVSLEVSCSAQQVEIRVIDQGVGMPAALQHRIHASRQGVHRPGTHGEPGTGFGLGLMKYFMESYRGCFDWKSQSREDGFEQTGTTMRFVLNRVRAGDLSVAPKGGTLGA